MRTLAIALCLLLTAGCGGKGTVPGTVKVSGKVTYKGSPLDGGTIIFISEDGRFSGTGRIASDGTFTLTTGAVPGNNKVVIKKVVGDVSAKPEEGMDEGQFEAQSIGNPGTAAKRKKIGETLPAQYSDPDKTILTFPVPDGGTSEANFNLT
jgi:hypothetical protein